MAAAARTTLNQIKKTWGNQLPDVQIIISDGLNARALMDDGHLTPFLTMLRQNLNTKGFSVGKENILIRLGRVRAGYQCGEVLFGKAPNSKKAKGIIHIIGERPGSGHHNFSAYLSAPSQNIWSKEGEVDHNISKVVSGISDTALKPELAVAEVVNIFSKMFTEGI